MSSYSLKPSKWALPLVIIAFVGLTITFLNPVFNVTSRWIILVFVVLSLVGSRGSFRALNNSVGFTALAMVLWSGTTALWSEVPELSLLKAIAFLIISSTGIALGMAWSRSHSLDRTLDFLLPLTIAALAAAVLGRVSANSVVYSGEGTFYQGGVGGSNMFGSLLAMCMPLAVWKVFRERTWQGRAIWGSILVIFILFLLASHARSAMLATLFTLVAFAIGYRNHQKLIILLGGILLSLAIYLLTPNEVNRAVQSIAYKQNYSESIFFSRADVWSDSYDRAVKGGIAGDGYGVTIGESYFQGALTTIGYGREQGNAQMAIVEQTGIIGLIIYLVFLTSLYATIIRGIATAKYRWHRQQLWLVGGALSGMLCMSLFEAWWVAPSSPESVYFWTMTGIAIGLSRNRYSSVQVHCPSSSDAHPAKVLPTSAS